MHGVFYEQNWLLQDFDSSHLLEYINKEGDTLKKNIHFPRFQLNTIIPPKWSGDSMALEISGLPDNAVLQVMLLDTSYISKGINKDISLKNNMIYLGKEEFAALKKGPVFLDLLYVDQSSIPEDSEDGGQLFMSYGLRRSFVLE